jgi:polyhydroxyalkanoate synthesis regulator phasin
MENYVSLFIATLQHLGHLTETEAKKLADELKNSTIPGSYEGASKLVKEIFDKLEVTAKK